MQRVCAVRGGVKAYLLDSDCLLTGETCWCPFCPDRHCLRRHGYYHRWAIFPGEDHWVRIPVVRLLCGVTGQTVSLLPDFCLPRRQYGPAVLGIFLHALGLLGLPTLAAFCVAVPGSTARSTAQALRDAFLRNAQHVRSFLCAIHPRHVPAPVATAPGRRELAALVIGLTAPSPCPGGAFVRHGAPFHARFHTGFA